MSWLALFFAIEIGLIPNDGFVMYDPPVEYVYDQSLYIQVEPEIEILDLIFVGGFFRTYVWKDKAGISFWPSRDGFQFRIGLRKEPFEVGFRHYCTHPVLPYQYPAKMNWEGAYQEVYFRLVFETP